MKNLFNQNTNNSQAGFILLPLLNQEDVPQLGFWPQQWMELNQKLP